MLDVVLIGSLACGKCLARSDADVVIVVGRASTPAPWRGPKYAPTQPVGVPVDVLVSTVEETRDWSPRRCGEVERGFVLLRR